MPGDDRRLAAGVQQVTRASFAVVGCHHDITIGETLDAPDWATFPNLGASIARLVEQHRVKSRALDVVSEAAGKQALVEGEAGALQFVSHRKLHAELAEVRDVLQGGIEAELAQEGAIAGK